MILFHPLETSAVRALQSGGPDYYGQTPERSTSGGQGTPCRHCLQNTPEGGDMLILSHRPFPNDQPYAEVGPIFLCGDSCAAFTPSQSLPPILQTSPDYLIKGYNTANRIVYGTGVVVLSEDLITASEAIFTDESVAYIHVRSARNNCYQCKITRT